MVLLFIVLAIGAICGIIGIVGNEIIENAIKYIKEKF